MLITFEGPGFVGKATQAKLLVDKLRSLGHEVLQLSFPSLDEFGVAAQTCSSIRDLPLAEQTRAVVTQACLISDRYAAMPEIQRQLLRGRIVVASRWALSGSVSGELVGLDLAEAQAGLARSDVEIVLTAPASTLHARAVAMGALIEERDLRRELICYNRHRLEAESPARLFFDGDAEEGGIARQIWGHVAILLRRQWG